MKASLLTGQKPPLSSIPPHQHTQYPQKSGGSIYRVGGGRGEHLIFPHYYFVRGIKVCLFSLLLFLLRPALGGGGAWESSKRR